MASKQVNIRMGELHLELLEKLSAALDETRTETIQVAVYSLAKEVLGEEAVKETVDRYLSGQK